MPIKKEIEGLAKRTAIQGGPESKDCESWGHIGLLTSPGGEMKAPQQKQSREPV